MSDDNVPSGGPDVGLGHTLHASITVDGIKHEIRAGAWIVHELKTAVGVDAAKALAEIAPHGLVDLADDARISVRDGQRFMSHARSGGSS